MKEYDLSWLLYVLAAASLVAGYYIGENEGAKQMRLTAQKEAAVAGVGKYIVGEKGAAVFALMECGKGEKK